MLMLRLTNSVGGSHPYVQLMIGTGRTNDQLKVGCDEGTSLVVESYVVIPKRLQNTFETASYFVLHNFDFRLKCTSVFGLETSS